MPVLEAQHLRKTYAKRVVVNDVSFNVNEGEIVGLLGRNGAGKTTSFRMTVGMISPDRPDGPRSSKTHNPTGDSSGGDASPNRPGRRDAPPPTVYFNGQDVTHLPMYQHARRGMGYLSQEPSVFQKLTVEQNLMAILETRRLRRTERKARAEELMGQFDLTKNRDQQARTLSGGERRKLEIARALITEPTLILLDEPFSGVDPVAVEELQREIRRLRDTGIAMLVTDHNVHHILGVCDRAYLLSEGRVMFSGTPKEMINDAQVRHLYLGSTFRGDEFG